MKNFEIITDSTCNMNGEELKEFNVKCIPMHFFIGDKQYEASREWTGLSAKEFYDLIRNGQRAKSSQVNAAQYEEAFVKAIESGCDVLSVSCTGALSASVNESYKARDLVLKKYPDAKVICIDSASACYALGLLVMEAAKLRAAGKTIEEVADWVEANKTKFNQVGTVDKLTYLKQAGRVSATAAFFGGILGVKPIIISDVEGHNVAIEKVKGKKASYEKCADYMEKYARPEVINRVYVAHGDCIDNAKELADIIAKRFPENTFDFRFENIEQGMGASCGPGTLIVDFYGDESIRVHQK